MARFTVSYKDIKVMIESKMGKAGGWRILQA